MAGPQKLIAEMMKREHVARMGQVRRAIDQLLRTQFAENTEAAVLAGALMQQARILLDQYPAGLREDLVVGAIAFLKGAGDPGRQRQKSPIWIPKGVM